MIIIIIGLFLAVTVLQNVLIDAMQKIVQIDAKSCQRVVSAMMIALKVRLSSHHI